MTAIVLPHPCAGPAPWVPSPPPVGVMAQRLADHLLGKGKVDGLSTRPSIRRVLGRGRWDAVVSILLGGEELIVSADAARRLAVLASRLRRQGAAIDLMTSADEAEATAHGLQQRSA